MPKKEVKKTKKIITKKSTTKKSITKKNVEKPSSAAKQKRNILFMVIAVILLVLSILGLKIIFYYQSYFHKGADLRTALHLIEEVLPESKDQLTWEQDQSNIGQVMSDDIREKMTSGYLRAWLSLREHFNYHKIQGLDLGFIGPAFLKMQKSIQGVNAENHEIKIADYRHRLKLYFFSEDKTICAIKAKVNIVTHLRDRTDGSVLNRQDGSFNFEIIMSLDDNYWRIRSIKGLEYISLEDAGEKIENNNFVQVKNGKIISQDKEFVLKGINYYPRGKLWRDFWHNFDEKEVDKDLEIMRSLEMNCVRVFIDYHAFGAQHIYPPMEKKLRRFLEIAGSKNIKVVVTLFDRIDPRTFYQLKNYSHIDSHLEKLVPLFKDNINILAWDVKNEPDLDYKFYTSEVFINEWVTHVINKIRTLDKNHLITVGALTPKLYVKISKKVDIISFHHFDYAYKFDKIAKWLKETYPQKPIVLQEFGYHTLGGIRFDSHEIEEQKEYIDTIMSSCLKYNFQGTLIWTLYDHPEELDIPPFEKHLGLIKIDDQLKPAAYVYLQKIIISPNPFYVRWGWLKRKGNFRLAFVNDKERRITLSIFKEKGELVRTLKYRDLISSGGQSFEWDGKNKTGETVCSGKYLIELKFEDTGETFSEEFEVKRSVPISIKDKILAVLSLICAIIGYVFFRKFKVRS